MIILGGERKGKVKDALLRKEAEEREGSGRSGPVTHPSPPKMMRINHQ